jgi:preprotein translocase subunit SecG
MLFGIAVFLYTVVCIFLCLLVLIQSDKGGGISSAMGGGLSGATSLLGAQDTANILTKATTGFVIAYMALCIGISLITVQTATSSVPKSVLKERAEKQEYTPASILQESELPIGSETEGEGTQPSQETPLLPGEELPVESETAGESQ